MTTLVHLYRFVRNGRNIGCFPSWLVLLLLGALLMLAQGSVLAPFIYTLF
jgi:hypothetical protein